MGWIILSIILFVCCVTAYIVGKAMKKTSDPKGTSDASDYPRYLKDAQSVRRVGGVLEWSAVIVFVLLFSLFTIARSFHSVQAGHVGVVYQFGNIVGQTDAGLVTTMPWQSLREANVQVQRVTFDRLDSFTQETQDVFIQATVNYQVSPGDIQNLYRSVGPGYFDKLVPTRVNQIFKDETVKYKAVNIAPNRETIRKNVLGRLKTALAPYSIQVDDLLIDNIKFSPEFTKSIEEKQIATQNAQAAKNRVRQAEFEANQVIATARGQAKAYRLKSQSLTPLIIQQNAIDKLNPNVQVLMIPSGGNFLFPSSVLTPKAGK